jgi:hypothetical protein
MRRFMGVNSRFVAKPVRFRCAKINLGGYLVNQDSALGDKFRSKLPYFQNALADWLAKS